MDISDNTITDEIEELPMFGEQDFFGNFLRNISMMNNLDSSHNAFLATPPIIMPIINTLSNNRVSTIPLTLPNNIDHISSIGAFNSVNSINNIMELSLDEKAKYKHVISSEGLKKIKYSSYKVKEDDEQICTITREIFKEGDAIAILPCKHLFNKKAILTWLQKKNAECPVCRSKFDSIEVKDEEVYFPMNTHGPMSIIPRYPNIRHMLMDLIDERMQEEDDLQIQQAIIASLRDD